MIISGEAYEVDAQELLEDWIVGVLLGVVGQGTEAGMQAAAQAMAGQPFGNGDTLDSDTVQAMLTDAEQDPEPQADRAETRRIYEALGLELPKAENAAPEGAAESTIINDDPAEHTKAEQRVIEEYKDSTDPQLVSFIERVRNLQNQDYKNGIRQVIATQTDKAARKAAELTGTSTTGFKTIINGSSIQHIDNRHGINGTADHSMADIQDFARIGFVLDNFTDARTIPISELDAEAAKLTKAWKNSNNTPAPMVQFSMPVNGVYYVVEAVPSGKAHVMAVVSAYISSGVSEKNSTLNQVLNIPEPPKAPIRSSTSETMLELLGADNRSLLHNDSVVNSAADDYALLSSAFPEEAPDYYAIFGLRTPNPPAKAENDIYFSDARDIIDGQSKQEKEFGVYYGLAQPLVVDTQLFSSQQFRSKFDGATGVPAVDEALFRFATKAALDNSGTEYESMYLIDARNGQLIAAIDSPEDKCKGGVSYTHDFERKMREAHEQGIPLISLHNHPGGFPPSPDDFRKAYENGYSLAFVIGANGQLYRYRNTTIVLTDQDCTEYYSQIDTILYLGTDPDRVYRELYNSIGLNYEIVMEVSENEHSKATKRFGHLGTNASY